MNDSTTKPFRHRAAAHLALVTLILLGAIACSGPMPGPATQGAASQGLDGTGIRSACASSELGWNPGGSGIGGTGHEGSHERERRTHQGLGDTGRQADSGLGGTGIVGILTGFASLCVDGVEIHYAPDTPVKMDGQRASVAALRIGHFVAALAVPGTAGLQARVIIANHSLVGPIEAVDTVRRRIRLLGAEVVLPPTVILADADGSALTLDQFRPGASVAVSGLWKSDGVVAATRVDRLPAPRRVSALGLIRTRTAQRFTISGIPAWAVRSGLLEPRMAGRTALVFGRWDGEQLVAEQIKPLPVVPFGGKVQRLTLEGYVTATEGAGRFRMLGTVVVERTPDSELLGRGPVRKGARVWVTGQLTPDLHLRATQVRVLE